MNIQPVARLDHIAGSLAACLSGKGRNLASDDSTTSASANRAFPQTEWTRVIEPVRLANNLEEISRKYWTPIYWYLRRKGYNSDSAKDLTQGFFLEIVMGRELVQRADRHRGRFRTLLLTALEHYIVSVHRRQKRPVVHSWNIPEDIEVIDPATAQPEEAFNYAWAATLLDRVLSELEEQCLRDGKGAHWRVFMSKVLEPILNDAVTPSLAQLCADYGIESESKASNMIVTIKRRFRAALLRNLRKATDSDADAEAEIGDLIEILSKCRAG